MTPADDYAFVGDPPSELIRPEADEVHISVSFTWDILKAIHLYGAWSQYYDRVRIAGPAFESHCNSFTPGLYIRRGVTFTSRGCNNQCPWCLVPEGEGLVRELAIEPGRIIQDNNLLQCNQSHINKVFEMLKRQQGIEFGGGLDSRLVTNHIVDSLRGLSIKQLFLACDTRYAVKPLEQAVKRLSGFTRRQLRCYVLIAFDGETLSEAEERLEDVWNVGCLPFAQLYQPPDRWIEYSPEWKALARKWSRPAAMISSKKGSPVKNPPLLNSPGPLA